MFTLYRHITACIEGAARQGGAVGNSRHVSRPRHESNTPVAGNMICAPTGIIIAIMYQTIMSKNTAESEDIQH